MSAAPSFRLGAIGSAAALVTALTVPLATASCCGSGAFTRDVEIDAGPQSCCLRHPQWPYEPGEPLNPDGIPLPRIGLRLGDTATFRAQADESYFGDSGCVPEGPLAPSSTRAPDRYTWFTDDRTKLSVRPDGHVRTLALGTHVLNAELNDPRVRGRALVAVVPWFDSIDVWVARDTVVVGDTVSVLLAAYDGGTFVPGITSRTALLRPEFSLEAPYFNTIFGQKDEAPASYVVQATRPGLARVSGGTSVHNARRVTGSATFMIVDSLP